MPREDIVAEFRRRVETELSADILPFWLRHVPDEEYGGFRGQITNDLQIDPHANKGLILNTRILWTFSRAYRIYREPALLKAANRAYEYVMHHFLDPDFGGFYWLVDHRGHPVDSRKKIYGQAFTIYALAEHFLDTGSQESLTHASRLFEQVERAAHDSEFGGYFETYNRDWSLASDQRLSEVDMDEKKSMNTHLHILEAYANLLHAGEIVGLRARLRELIHIFVDYIIDPGSHHFRLFFDPAWDTRSNRISFGHDIEGSWLLCEAAERLGEPDVLSRIRHEAAKMAEAVRAEAVDADGGLFYEAGPQGIIDTDKHWWPQAEAVVGFLNAWQITAREDFFTYSLNSWDFIEKYLVDRRHGEWFWKVSREGVPSGDKYKVDPWKCPYHNSRTCFEVLARLPARQNRVFPGAAKYWRP
jgi:mannobiose 2-epimerase